jgi:hypothetical protein
MGRVSGMKIAGLRVLVLNRERTFEYNLNHIRITSPPGFRKTLNQLDSFPPALLLGVDGGDGGEVNPMDRV